MKSYIKKIYTNYIDRKEKSIVEKRLIQDLTECIPLIHKYCKLASGAKAMQPTLAKLLQAPFIDEKNKETDKIVRLNKFYIGTRKKIVDSSIKFKNTEINIFNNTLSIIFDADIKSSKKMAEIDFLFNPNNYPDKNKITFSSIEKEAKLKEDGVYNINSFASDLKKGLKRSINLYSFLDDVFGGSVLESQKISKFITDFKESQEIFLILTLVLYSNNHRHCVEFAKQAIESDISITKDEISDCINSKYISDEDGFINMNYMEKNIAKMDFLDTLNMKHNLNKELANKEVSIKRMKI